MPPLEPSSYRSEGLKLIRSFEQKDAHTRERETDREARKEERKDGLFINQTTWFIQGVIKNK